jgi:hypothetical protein
MEIAVRLRAFAQNFPKKEKIDGTDLWIDIDKLTNAIVLEGLVPNAGEIKGFSAPVDQREPARPHAVAFYGARNTTLERIFGRPHPTEYRYVRNKAKTGAAGVEIRDVDYYGGGEHLIDKSIGYFGVHRYGKVQAFGISEAYDTLALPAYYYVSVPEWLVDEQGDELNIIIGDAVNSVMNAAI